jgi:hypothetical protein
MSSQFVVSTLRTRRQGGGNLSLFNDSRVQGQNIVGSGHVRIQKSSRCSRSRSWVPSSANWCSWHNVVTVGCSANWCSLHNVVTVGCSGGSTVVSADHGGCVIGIVVGKVTLSFLGSCRVPNLVQLVGVLLWWERHNKVVTWQ